MTKTLTLIFTLLATSLFSQVPQSVELKWKIESEDTLNYTTIMSQLDSSEYDFDIGGFFKSTNDEIVSFSEEIDSVFDMMSYDMRNQNYVSSLTKKSNDVIDIVMTTKPKVDEKPVKRSDNLEFNAESFVELYKTLNQGFLMRGSVYTDGGMHSFWVASAQKNIMALFFELPSKPVNVGDTWSLDIKFIDNALNFVCDSAYRINEVKLSEIKVVNGDTIAVLLYNIEEYIDGVIIPPPAFLTDKENIQAMMKYSYQGVSEFSITNGHWLSYYGIMSTDVTGFIRMNYKQQFALLKE